jgi:hypothetical protein
MSKHKLKLSRIADLANAVELVGGNDRLSGKTSYWLGRLGDFCSGPMKVAKTGQEKAMNRIKPEQDELLQQLDGLDPVKSKLEVEKLQRQIQACNVKYTEAIQEVMEQEEDVEIPEFKMAQFIADADITYSETLRDIDKDGKEVTRKIELTVKKGQSLVPIRFFKLMGEFVTE